MILYVLLVAIGSTIAARLILGELRKERRNYVVLVQPEPQSSPAPQPEPIVEIKPDPAAVRYEKPRELSHWEKIIAEKNAQIHELKTDVKIYRAQSREFEKIKSLLERQIFESRQLHHATRRDADLLKAQAEKLQEEINKLRIELNYKNQLLAQNEVKNRVSNVVPDVTTPETAPAPAKKALDLGDFSFDQLDWRNKVND